MKKKTIKLAIDALRKQARVYAFDANLYEIHACDNPHAETSYRLHRDIYTAIAELEREKQNAKS